jgi:2-methylcitrate dehydratase PrpD
MIQLDRRAFVRTLAVAAFPPAAVRATRQALVAGGGAEEAQAAAQEVTRRLARYVVSARPEDLPAPVRHEARRAILNWVGCAVGGSRHETIEVALAALAPFVGPPQASVLGRGERLDVLHAALVNGMSSHVHDFDDTHLETVIHPSAPVLPALFALAELRPVSGRELLHAFVLGVEVECRIGKAVFPAHYDRGWHITGTVGVFGAAAAVGRLLGLTEQQMVWALGLAATQPVGLREMFGTMTKSFHPGRAAENGLTAALLAARGFTSSEAPLEAKSGWAHVLSTEQKWDRITERLGERYELAVNSYKPFACGVVLHPVIDGCLQLRRAHGVTADGIERVELGVHPLVLELTGKRAPRTGLEGKFSVYFAAAVALVQGAAGVQQFTDAVVRDPVIAALGERVTAVVEPSVHEDQARVAIVLKDGRRLEVFVEHAVGSVARPMSDADLEAKVLGLCDGILPADRARRLVERCWRVDALDRASLLAEAARG